MQPEVIIVGAGPAGSGTAWHLARAGVPTLLLDKAEFPRDKVCGDCLSPRAQTHLARMGLLDRIAAEAHHAPQIRFRAPGGAAAEAALTAADGGAGHTLVLPRERLDHLIQQHALAAGAEFRVAHVRRLLRTDDDPGAPVRGVLLGERPVPARLVVIATGAALGLVKQTPLAPSGPVHSVAARCYVRGIRALDPALRFHFDGLPLPGYAWVFPTGPAEANLGYWYTGSEGVAAAMLLPQLLASHPELRALLDGAEPPSRIAGYPIRSDFLRARKLAPGLLAVGEAAGLVNPFTGEGIDYALESAELAAAAIIPALAAGTGPLPQAALRAYPRALDRHFRGLFRLMELAQRHAFNPWMFDRLFGRGERGQRLVDQLIAVCFGAAPPHRLLDPLELGRLVLARPARPALLRVDP